MKLAAFLLWGSLFLTNVLTANQSGSNPDAGPDSGQFKTCDSGVELAADEAKELFAKLRISKKGQEIIKEYEQKYFSLNNLKILWDSVSYSQISSPPVQDRGRSLASASANAVVCIHLANKLPAIEHVADLAHELTHAARLERKVLKGEVGNAQEFVKTRIQAAGGEADAFAVECQVKKEILGQWDTLCAPYANEKLNQIDVQAVIEDLYNGKLSASLTGETYPTMLAKQFKTMLENKRRFQ